MPRQALNLFNQGRCRPFSFCPWLPVPGCPRLRLGSPPRIAARRAALVLPYCLALDVKPGATRQTLPLSPLALAPLPFKPSAHVLAWINRQALPIAQWRALAPLPGCLVNPLPFNGTPPPLNLYRVNRLTRRPLFSM